MIKGESVGGLSKHTLRMTSDAADRLCDASRIGLAFATYGDTAEIISAKLVFRDPDNNQQTARYAARRGSKISDLGKLDLIKVADKSSGVVPMRQTVVLTIMSRGAPNLALHGQFSREAPLTDMLWVGGGPSDGGESYVSVFGWVESAPSGTASSKAGLLAHQWGIGVGGSGFIYASVLATAGLWLGGLISLYGNRPLAGSMLLFLSAGLMYALLVPPFQAPDEADHLLTYANVTHDETLRDRALELANAGHFERIKFHSNETFSSQDVPNPEKGDWAAHIAPTEINRSPLARLAWKLSGFLIGYPSAGLLLFSLRVAGLVFVSLSLLVSLTIGSVACGPGRMMTWLAAPALLVPSLLFFTASLSNYSFLIGAYLMQATAFSLLWRAVSGDGAPRIFAAIALLSGAGLAVGLCASDNAIFAFIFWAIIIPAGLLLACREKQSPRLLANRFFIVFAFALLLPALAVAAASPGLVFLPVKIQGLLLRMTPAEGSLAVLGGPLVIFGYALVLYFATQALLTIWRHLGLLAGFLENRYFWGSLWMLAVTAVVLIPAQFVPNIQTATAPVNIAGYTWMVIHAFLDGFSIGVPDTFVVRSFWGIFGWLDTPLPGVLTESLRLAAGAGIVLLMGVTVLGARIREESGFLLASLSAIVLMAGMIAAGHYVTGYNVHGRYLIGLYLLAFVLSAEGFRRCLSAISFPPCGDVWGTAGVCILCMAVQSTAWLTIIDRYF